MNKIDLDTSRMCYIPLNTEEGRHSKSLTIQNIETMHKVEVMGDKLENL